MNKLLPITILVAVVVGGIAFYSGTKYSEGNSTASIGGRAGFSQEDFRNLSPEERQQRFQEFGANGSGAFSRDHEGGSGFRGRFGTGSDGSRPLIGEIISQGDGSLTIKLSDGSTKIVFVNDSTQITKSVDGTVDDLDEGEQIFVSGDENPDGSYTAKTIQLGSFDHNQQSTNNQ